MKTEGKCRHFRELTLNLHRAGFTVEGETPDGLLPVELDGRRLCRVTENGGVRYREEAVAGAVRGAALKKVIDIAMTTTEYMRQMEAAPFLKADGLDEGYRLLAEFNGTVLAGQQTRYGAQFITWTRTYDGSGVTQGHYHGFSGTEGYTAARQDFAVRSGLLPRERVFSDKQLAVIFDAAQHMEALGLSSNPEQSRLLEEIMEQIESAVPQVIDIANELTQQPVTGGMVFSIWSLSFFSLLSSRLASFSALAGSSKTVLALSGNSRFHPRSMFGLIPFSWAMAPSSFSPFKTSRTNFALDCGLYVVRAMV